MQPIKVCCFCESWESGGIESFLCSVLCRIDPKRVQIDLVCASQRESIFTQPMKEHGIHFYELSGSQHNLPENYRRFQKLLEKRHYDVLHLNAFHGVSLYYLHLAKRAGVSIRIAHSHNTECSHRKAHIIMRTLFEWGCNSRLACGEEAGQWLFGGKKFDIIKNGINAECYQYNAGVRKCVRNSLEIDADEIVLGHVGIFNEQKNHSFLIEIFNECLKIKKNIRLMLIGEGEQKDNIYEKAVQLGIENKIVFIGVTNKVEQYLSAMDHFVFPSLYEGFGIALLEAQCSGLSCTISSEMTQDAVILNTTKSISLTKSATEWAEVILDERNLKKREEAAAIVKKAGYDISENRLSFYYEKLLKR